MHTLCLDFGTSSIRAALMKHNSRVPHPLPIAPGSIIDNASIPSAIYIPSAGDEISFGMDALERGLTSRKPILFELSPKSWLRPEIVAAIDEPAADRLPFTRRQLIGGLLALALKASSAAALRQVNRSSPQTLRISHPVWPAERAAQLSRVYASFHEIALGEGPSLIKATMPVRQFERWCATNQVTDAGPTPVPDVEEPVAAALELFPDVEPSSRTATLVVDVGAGTIDLGLFSSVVPDDRSSVRRKLISVSPPRSLFGAGDVIDEELVMLVREKLASRSDAELAALRNNIRSRKEQLFQSGQMAYRSVNVTAAELTNRPRLVRMAEELQHVVTEMLSSSAVSFEPQRNALTHRLDDLHVIFAGGGANLQFLQSAVAPAVRKSRIGLRAVPHAAVTPAAFEVEASLCRMAVAMGGTVPTGEWPETKMRTARIHALSPPVRRSGLT